MSTAKGTFNRIMRIYEQHLTGIYFFIRRITKTRRERRCIFIVFSPILLVLLFFSWMYEKLFANWVAEQIIKKDACREFEDEISIVFIIKNEGLYIEEWLNYYMVLGVKKFYLYDNESTDNIKEILKPYIDAGIVIYKYFPGRAKQLDAYYDALGICRKKSRYMITIDPDEFIVPTKDEKLLNVIKRIFALNHYIGALAVNWYVYGSAGHETKPEGLVMENYRFRAKDDAEPNRLVKTIVNPRLVQGYSSPHSVWLKGKCITVNENGHIVTSASNEYPNNSYNQLRINHYYCKSKQETKVKFERGRVSAEIDIKRKWSEFNRFDRNEVEDYTIGRYVDAVKESMTKYQ